MTAHWIEIRGDELSPTMLQEKPMPNAKIAVGTSIFIGNAHLHRRQDSEMEDVATVDGITDVEGWNTAGHFMYWVSI